MALYLYGLYWLTLNFYLYILEYHLVLRIKTLIELSGLQVTANGDEDGCPGWFQTSWMSVANGQVVQVKHKAMVSVRYNRDSYWELGLHIVESSFMVE